MRTFETSFPNVDMAEFAFSNPNRDGDRTLPSGVLLDVTVTAVGNQGRWVVDCPDPSCVGAELASDTGRFFCCACRNRANGNAYLTVVFPAQRATIEAVLSVRPADNRNWLPGDTVAALKADNLAHDLPATG